MPAPTNEHDPQAQLPSLDHAEDPIILFTFDWQKEAEHKKYSASPFCNKLIFRLEQSGNHFESQPANRNQAPKGKVPYVYLPRLKKYLGDSDLIIKHLVNELVVPDINGELSELDRAQDHLIRALVEDSLYFQLVYERYVEQFAKTRQKLPFKLPTALRGTAGLVIQQYCKLQLYMQGIGRHTTEENQRLREESLQVLNTYATVAMEKCESDAKNPFFILGGAAPTEADFALYGYLTAVLSAENNPHHKQIMAKQNGLCNYASRMHETYFGDYSGLF